MPSEWPISWAMTASVSYWAPVVVQVTLLLKEMSLSTITWPDCRTRAVMARQEPVQPLPEAQSTVLVPLVLKPVVVVPALVSTWLALDTLVQEAAAFDRAVLLPEPWLAVLRRQL